MLLLGGIYGNANFSYTTCFMLSFLVFIAGQVQILKTKLRNITTFSKIYREGRHISEELARKLYLKECILEHQKLYQ